MARNGLLLPPEREKADAEASLPRRFVSPVDPALPIKEEAVAIDPDHAYTLAELIDIAQRSNKQTRVAWEAARQAAITVGIALGSLSSRHHGTGDRRLSATDFAVSQ